MAYLTYLIDFYSTLPSLIAFVHSHRDGWPGAWHTDNGQYSNPLSLQTFKHEYVHERGYANLRCNWIPGCGRDDLQPYRNPPKEDRTEERAMVEIWALLFDGAMAPERIGVACCSQFAVSREQVRKRSKEEYVKYRKWLLETPMDDETSGRVLEYLWHVMFGRESVE